MGAHNSLHKSSKTSQGRGEYNTELHPPQMQQSNGQAEQFVQTIKNSLNKAIEGEEDPHLAILSYIITPLNHSLPSPAELLNSRKYRCLLPIQTKIHSHQHRKQCRDINPGNQHTTTEMQGTCPVSRLAKQSMYN